MSIIVIVGGAIITYVGWTAKQKKRLIQDTPTSKVRSIAMGLVEVKGKVMHQEPMFTTPLTKTEVVFYSYSVEEYRSSGKSGRWVTLQSGREGEYFWLEDETGKVLVDTKQSDLDIRKHSTERISEELKQYLESHGISYKQFFGLFHKQMRFTEQYLEPQKEVYILSTAQDNPFIEDGTTEYGSEDVMLAHAKGNPHIISEHSESKTINKYFWKSLLLYLGPALIVAGILMSLAML